MRTVAGERYDFVCLAPVPRFLPRGTGIPGKDDFEPIMVDGRPVITTVPGDCYVLNTHLWTTGQTVEVRHHRGGLYRVIPVYRQCDAKNPDGYIPIWAEADLQASEE